MVSREDKIKNYHLEFDGLVEACNGWLVSQCQNRTEQQPNFEHASIPQINIWFACKPPLNRVVEYSAFQQTIPSVLECRHPLDSRDDLTSTQKILFCLLLIVKGLKVRLEQLIISARGNTSAEQAIKALAQQKYEFLRESYVSCALKAEKIN